MTTSTNTKNIKQASELISDLLNETSAILAEFQDGAQKIITMKQQQSMAKSNHLAVVQAYEALSTVENLVKLRQASVRASDQLNLLEVAVDQELRTGNC